MLLIHVENDEGPSFPRGGIPSFDLSQRYLDLTSELNSRLVSFDTVSLR